jgi:hypothetical protein
MRKTPVAAHCIAQGPVLMTPVPALAVTQLVE